MKDFFTSMPRNVIACFKGRNLAWQIVAVGLTALIVFSGFDWQWFVGTRGNPFLPYLFPAVILGAFLPILVPLGLIAGGAAFKRARLTVAGWAIGQAALIGFLLSSFYKAFTGRVPPPLSGMLGGASVPTTALADTSHQFLFGFLRGGVFWGWPSSHTAVAFAMAFAVIALWPRHKALVCLSFLYALYIGLGVSVSIHWFSEFVAGAIIGAVIGVVVGKCFKNKIAST